MEVSVDAVGNLFGRRFGKAGTGEIWSGSHLDSVPEGGRFDGALGVVAALEAAERLDQPERTLVVVAFRDEEGWRFGGGCFGSRALVGRLAPNDLESADAAGITVEEALRTLGHGRPPAGRLDPAPDAFVELHIEQGPVLDGLDAPLGIVTSIVGLARLRAVFHGQAGHVGTTPMAGRRDALVSASRFVLAVKEAAEARTGAVATVGQLHVEPNAAGVVPARVEALVDVRAPHAGLLAELVTEIESADTERLVEFAPVDLDPVLRRTMSEVFEEQGLPAVELHSGAGHDAAVLAAAGIPTAMLFVRSRAGGVSHSTAEHSDDADVALAVDALERVLRRLASVSPP